MLLKWLLIGLIAGSIAKMMTPQEEGGGWVSSLLIGVTGSVAGGFIANLLGFSVRHALGSLIVAVIGSLIVLFIYHRYLTKYF